MRTKNVIKSFIRARLLWRPAGVRMLEPSSESEEEVEEVVVEVERVHVKSC